jgi:hypothetical protein
MCGINPAARRAGGVEVLRAWPAVDPAGRAIQHAAAQHHQVHVNPERAERHAEGQLFDRIAANHRTCAEQAAPVDPAGGHELGEALGLRGALPVVVREPVANALGEAVALEVVGEQTRGPIDDVIGALTTDLVLAKQPQHPDRVQARMLDPLAEEHQPEARAVANFRALGIHHELRHLLAQAR